MTPRLSLAGVSVSLGGRRIVTDAALELSARRLVALLGPNGAGKTTLLKAMAGLVPATGAIRLDGRDIRALSRRERARRIAYLPQGHQVHWPLAARDVAALGRLPHGLADPARMTAEHAAAVERALARTDALAFADRPVSVLSGGERARVMLARALAVEAGVLLADEPTAALDPRHQIAVMQDLKAEAERGALVVAVTHDIQIASRMADSIALMDQGRIVGVGPPAEVLTDEALRAVYRVEAVRIEGPGGAAVLPWSLA